MDALAEVLIKEPVRTFQVLPPVREQQRYQRHAGFLLGLSKHEVSNEIDSSNWLRKAGCSLVRSLTLSPISRSLSVDCCYSSSAPRLFIPAATAHVCAVTNMVGKQYRAASRIFPAMCERRDDSRTFSQFCDFVRCGLATTLFVVSFALSRKPVCYRRGIRHSKDVLRVHTSI